jgi:YegS/Rv2252/BmrU family lipid kinase
VALVVRRALLIVNPASRRGGSLQTKALDAFRSSGVRCDAVVTEEPGHGAALAARLAREYDAVFTLGGDGTAVEVLGATTGLGVPTGILPGGTGNLLARTLGIPLDVRRAARALLAGEAVAIDLGVLGDGRRFAFSAGLGLDVRMIEGAPARLKRRLGVFAYVLSAGRAVLRRDDFAARVTVDGVAYERTAAAVMVANFGAVLNDMIHLGPGIRSDDGLLDLCVFSPATFVDSVRVLRRLLRKDFRSDPSMLYVTGTRFLIETDRPRTAQADGEIVGSTPIEIRVDPRAGLVLVPSRRR